MRAAIFSPKLYTAMDFVLPRGCCECGGEIHGDAGNGLCWDCRSDSLPLGPPWCETCGMVIAGRVDHAFVCNQCQEHRPAFTQARSLYRYEGGVRTAIHALKYHRDFSVVPDLARLLAAGAKVHLDNPETYALAAVPLHTRKLRERGFNQSQELTRYMRKWLPGQEIWTGLRRVKYTETQTHLTAAGRRSNVRGAFQVKSKSIPDKILLIDDVMTTGSTVDACARAMKKAGAKEVRVMTLARG
ncbi:MAG: ComF family protein [Verrucomicrobia bacterium]|nr:ComF family protein [Verrucomicrobiota bacterium]MCH8514244.1 ComF family protein [Kiritimatiellia bacterium]